MQTLRSIVILASMVRFADAEPAAELITRAQAQWDDLEYEGALVAAQSAASATDATTAQKIEALRIAGSALVVLDRPDDAAHVFEQLFALAPDYQMPPKTSPRLLAIFEPTRARWQVAEEQRLATELGAALRALQLQVMLPTNARGGRPIHIGVELADPNAIADRIVLSHRRHGDAYYTTTELRARPGRLTFTISGEDSASRDPYVLDLHVVARHRSGVAVRREASADQPLALSVAAGSVPTPSPITHRWWFWAGIVVVAAGSAYLIDRAIDVGPQRVTAQP